MAWTRVGAGVLLLTSLAACGTEVRDDGSAPAPAAAPAMTKPETLDLRYTVRPRTDKLFAVRLPKQKPGGTAITWSAYLSGVGAAASPAVPIKAECYVVQATGRSFDDRVFYLADDSSISTGDDISLSGAGVVDTKKGRVLTFECELDENRPAPIAGLTWQTHPQQPIQVTITPVHDYREKRRTVR